jgi:hypothetical protein
MTGHHEFVWDGSGKRGSYSRLSIIPGAAASDLRFTAIHFRILLHIGRFDAAKGWCRCSQTDLSTYFGVRRQSVSKASSELVRWGYIEKRSQRETRESLCQYRAFRDVVPAPEHAVADDEETMGVSDLADTPPVSAAADTSVFPEQTPVSPLRTQEKEHIKHIKHTPLTPKWERQVVKSALPADWQLPDDWRQWAAKHSPPHAKQIFLEAETFADHWRSTGNKKFDWQATWRNWWRRACQRPPAKDRFDVTGAVTASTAFIAQPGITLDWMFGATARTEDVDEVRVYRSDTPEFHRYVTELIAQGDTRLAEQVKQRGFVKARPSRFAPSAGMSLLEGAMP